LGAIAIALAQRPAVDVAAQTLDLGRPKPPALGDDSFVPSLIEQLQHEEREWLDRARATEGGDRLALTASAHLRSLAIDLLELSEHAGSIGDVAWLAGATAANGRSAIDDAIQRIASMGDSADGPERLAEARIELETFLARRIDFDVSNDSSSDVVTLDARVAAAFGPLARAIGSRDDSRDAAPWPDEPTSAHEGVAATTDLGERIAAARVRAETLHLAPAAAAAARASIDAVERGLEFPEFLPRVEDSLAIIDGALAFVEASARTAWIDEATRAAWFAQVSDALVAHRDAATRGEAEAALRRFAQAGAAIERADALASVSRDRVDPRPILAAVSVTLQPASSDVVDGGREARLSAIVVTLETMIEARSLRIDALRGELRTIARKIENAARDCERDVLARLTETGGSQAMVDDAVPSSRSAMLRQYADDLDRLQRLSDWADLVERISPGAREGFEAQSLRMARWLLDAGRRGEAVMAMEQFERQAARFTALPFEEPLRSNAEIARALTGEQAVPLLAAIERQRGTWAEGWARGDAAGPAASRMLLLHRLAQAMADAASLEGDGLARLNGWPAWEGDPTTVRAAAGALRDRLRLATRTAVDGDGAELVRQIERIEIDAAFARLAGRLAAALADSIATQPDAASGTLAQLASPVRSSSRFASRRPALAEACRWAAEAAHAHVAGDGETALRCLAHANAVALDLLDRLGDHRGPLPTLSIFDGS
jgi:hypothetical protein